MPKLAALATNILLTLSVSTDTQAYSVDFTPSGASTMPALLQFDEGRGPSAARDVINQDHLQPPTAVEQTEQTPAQSGERHAAKDDF